MKFKTNNIKNVNRGIDFSWLIENADDQKSKEILIEADERYQKYGRDTRDLNGEISKLSIAGIKVLVRHHELPSVLKVFTEIYKENLHFLIENFVSEEDKYILDFGANSGYFAIKASQIATSSKIYAFEPNPAPFYLLSCNIDQNNIQNVYTVNVGVGADNEVISFKSVDEASTLGGRYLGNLEKSNFDWITPDQIHTFEVEVWSLKYIFERFNLPYVDVIKFDIQNMEKEVLFGAEDILKHIRKIILEPHDPKDNLEIEKLLMKHGFEKIYHEDREHGDTYWVNNSFQSK